MKPVVSVIMITYKQEAFVKEAVEGVLMQECDFDVELIIADDCSPDDTENAVKEIINTHKNAHRIQYTKHEQNMGMEFNFDWAVKKCTGKYIAICEGDDYWTDPYKLQKQVDFLERNEDCSMCGHNTRFTKEYDPEDSYNLRPKNIPLDSKFNIRDLITDRVNYSIHTSSLVFHRQFIKTLPEWLLKAPVRDYPLKLLLATKGNVGYIDEIMSVFRIGVSGSWSSSMLTSRNRRREHHYSTLQMWTEFDIWTNKKYHSYIIKKKLIIKWRYLKGNILRLTEIINKAKNLK